MSHDRTESCQIAAPEDASGGGARPRNPGSATDKRFQVNRLVGFARESEVRCKSGMRLAKHLAGTTAQSYSY